MLLIRGDNARKRSSKKGVMSKGCVLVDVVAKVSGLRLRCVASGKTRS